MGILNLTEDGFPGLVVALYQALSEFGPQRESDLVNICAGSAEPHRYVRKSLRRWTQIGLFEVADGFVSIGERIRETCDGSIDSIKTHMRELVLDRRNVEPSEDSDTGIVSDFIRGTSWLLAQDIYKIDTSSADTIQPLEVEQYPPGQRALQNNTRWSGLRQWVVFFGFAWEGPQLVIDPTVAVRDSLKNVFAHGGVMTAKEFCSNLATQIPVLDGGVYRNGELKNLVVSNISLPGPGQLSMALSIALFRLKAEKILSFERKADAGEGAALIGFGHKPIDNFTHVGLRGSQ